MSTCSVALAAVDGLQTRDIWTEILDQVDRNVDVAARGLGIRARLVPGFHQCRKPPSFSRL